MPTVRVAAFARTRVNVHPRSGERGYQNPARGVRSRQRQGHQVEAALAVILHGQHASVVELVHVNDAVELLDDLDLVLRVTVRFQAVFLDVPAFAYRRHPGGIARDRERVREEAIRLAEKLAREHPEALERLGRTAFIRRQARRYARLAASRLRAGDARGARQALAEARALDPRNLAYRLRALWLTLRSS